MASKTSKGNDELAKKMQDAFKKAGVQVGIDTITQVMSDTCENCHDMGCRDGCKDGCLAACASGNK